VPVQCSSCSVLWSTHYQECWSLQTPIRSECCTGGEPMACSAARELLFFASTQLRRARGGTGRKYLSSIWPDRGSSPAVPSPKGDFSGLSPTNKALRPANWNMKHYKLVEFLSNSNAQLPSGTNVKPPYWRLSGDGSRAQLNGFGSACSTNCTNQPMSVFSLSVTWKHY